MFVPVVRLGQFQGSVSVHGFRVCLPLFSVVFQHIIAAAVETGARESIVGTSLHD